MCRNNVHKYIKNGKKANKYLVLYAHYIDFCFLVFLKVTSGG